MHSSWVRTYLRGGLSIFIFHDVTDSPSPFQRLTRSSVSTAVFERQLDWIGERFEFIDPSWLPQFGGAGELPPNAALISFDDAWAGIVQTAAPILARRGLACLWFVNTGTLAGNPDLAVVRTYDAVHGRGGWPHDVPLSVDAGAQLIAELRGGYVEDHSFESFQGRTATSDDLEAADRLGAVWFASHLEHHWALSEIEDALFELSYKESMKVLQQLTHWLPGLALPYGGNDRSLCPGTLELAREFGCHALFLGRGGANGDPSALVLDRLWFPPEPASEQAWWWGVHRARVCRTWASGYSAAPPALLGDPLSLVASPSRTMGGNRAP